MRVLQLGRELDLPSEPLDVDASGEIRRQHLHHHLPLERHLLGHKHPRHPTTAELPLEGVGAAECALELFLEVGQKTLGEGGLMYGSPSSEPTFVF